MNNYDESVVGPNLYSWDRVSTNKFLAAPNSHPFSHEVAHRKYLNFNEYLRFDFAQVPMGNNVVGSSCSSPSKWSSLSSFELASIPGGTLASGGVNGLPTFVGELEMSDDLGLETALPLRYTTVSPFINQGDGVCSAVIEALVSPKVIVLAYSKFEDIWTIEIDGTLSSDLIEYDGNTNSYKHTQLGPGGQNDTLFSLDIEPGNVPFEDGDGFMVTLLSPQSTFPNGLFLGHTQDLNFDIND